MQPCRGCDPGSNPGRGATNSRLPTSWLRLGGRAPALALIRFPQEWMVDVSNNNLRLGKLTHCKIRLNSFAFAGGAFEQELVTSLTFEHPRCHSVHIFPKNPDTRIDRWECQQAIRKRLGRLLLLA